MEKILNTSVYGELVRCKNEAAWRDFTKSMDRNNTFCPSIKNVIFNLKTTESVAKQNELGDPITDAKGRVIREQVALVNPVLATTVMFADGTKTTVVNSLNDKIQTERKEIVFKTVNPDGSKTETKTGKFATVATDAAKEAGLVYAVVKRLVGVQKTDERTGLKTDTIVGDGFGRKLRDLLGMAYDTQFDAAWAEAAKAQRAKEHKEREAAAKARKANRKPTFEENIATIAEALRKQAATSETKMA